MQKIKVYKFKQGMDRRLLHISQETDDRAPTWWWVVQRIPQWDKCSQAYKPASMSNWVLGICNNIPNSMIQHPPPQKKKISKAWKSQEH